MSGSRFSLEDVRAIMSEEHRRNTRGWLGHEPDNEELIAHWLAFHCQPTVYEFDVRPADEPEEASWLFT